LQALDAPTLANRAACLLWLGEAKNSLADATAALEELDAENKRDETETSFLSGLFPAAPPSESISVAFKTRADNAPVVSLFTNQPYVHIRVNPEYVCVYAERKRER